MRGQLAVLAQAEPAVSHADHSAESPFPEWPIALLDRRSGDLAIARELARARRDQRSDGLGPPDLLVAVCQTLTKAILGSDLAIHWSSEELLLVLPGLGVIQARQVAERVRAVMQAGARHGAAVSGGVAELLADDTFEAVVARASENVRLAREHDYNRVA